MPKEKVGAAIFDEDGAVGQGDPGMAQILGVELIASRDTFKPDRTLAPVYLRPIGRTEQEVINYDHNRARYLTCRVIAIAGLGFIVGAARTSRRR
ncbi:MAG: hypothetical protein JWO96_835 [Candidatus Saccharibacteria bacterium]|nr:hypothetical protein [Candidatus Saccharibacteria bacterium]